MNKQLLWSVHSDPKGSQGKDTEKTDQNRLPE